MWRTLAALLASSMRMCISVSIGVWPGFGERRPSVKTTEITRIPFPISLAIVPPIPISASSGCALTTKTVESRFNSSNIDLAPTYDSIGA